MKKRLNFICYQCKRIFSFLLDLDLQQKKIVACPFCRAEYVVDLSPHQTAVKTILRDDSKEEQIIGYEYQFPEIIPTPEPKQPEE